MIEKLLNLFFENPTCILYINVNGKETIFINGKEIKDEENKDDDALTKKYVNDFKVLIKELDDDLFVEFSEELAKVVDLNTMDNLLEQKSFTKNETECIEYLITQAKNVLAFVINSQIERLEDLKAKL